MASRSSRPLPPAPDSQAGSLGSCSDKAEDVSLFSHASGPMQINDGDFSAIKGDRFGRVQIVIHQGGPRSMKPPKVAPVRLEESPSGSSVRSSTSSILPRGTLPIPQDYKETDAELLAELTDQIARWKERKQHLDSRAAELISWERDLAAQAEAIQAKEYDLRQKEQQLAERELIAKEKQEHLEHVRRKLSAMEDNLSLREKYLKEALDDLRLRERAVNEQSNLSQRGGCRRSLSSISDTLSSTLQMKDNDFEDLSNDSNQSPQKIQKIAPNRRSALLLDTPPISHPDRTIVPNGTSLVRVTHTRQLPQTPDPLLSGKPLLATLGEDPEGQSSSEDEGYVNGLDAWLDGSSTEDLRSMVEPDNVIRPELSGGEDRSIVSRPPTYRENPDSIHAGPVKAKRAQQLQDLITVLKVASEDERSWKAAIPASTAFSGALLREHVEDIEHIHDWAERAQAISWAIEMMVEKGRFDEHTVCTLCDRISEDGQSANVAVLVLKREMGRSHLTLIPLNAIRLLRTMLANTASIFREHCCLPHFMSLLEKMSHSEETNPAVRARAGEVIKIIKHGHGASPQFNVSRSNGGWQNSASYGLAY